MNATLEQYRVEPSSLWMRMLIHGYSGYDAIEESESRGWIALADWGKAHGYDLGSWPYVIVFWRTLKDGRFQVVEYVEGDATQYDCPSAEIRQQITDEIAFFHWKFNCEEWVAGYDTIDQLPDELRGPFRS